ncbi:MAG TPA: hypothetical protein VML01_05970 [Bryobacterales bacterium]|nr:hypothetical protein [Bryobacterales bacterium]
MKNKKLLAVNILLGILVVAAAFGLYSRIEAANQRYSILTPGGPAKELPDYPAPEAPRRVRAGDHLPIVERTLFSPDRNPIIEVVAEAPPPPDPRPPLPRLAGIMELGKGPIALMSVDLESTAGPIQVGEKIGAFTFLGTEGDKVLLQWKEEKFAASPGELLGSSGGGNKRAGAAGTRAEGRQRGPERGALARREPAGSGGAAAAQPSAAKPAQASVLSSGNEPRIGPDQGGGRYRAYPTDKSPDGTRHQGFVKRSQGTPFGTKSWWEKEQK